MIVVFGSLNADFFLNINHFPEPGETILTPKTVVKAGGKGGNQAAAAGKVGAVVKMVGAVGIDTISDVPLNALKMATVDVTPVVKSNNSTGMAMIMVDVTGENSIVVASGANLDLKAEHVPQNFYSKENVFVFQMETEKQETFKVINKAKLSGAKVVLNVAPANEVPINILKNVDYLILNEIEAKTVYQSEKSSDEIAVQLAKMIEGVCIITLGKQGVVFADKEKLYHQKALQIKPVDTTGAGDTFVGIFSAMIDRGFPLEKAVQYASVGASLACLKNGAQEGMPNLSQIEKMIENID
ncbi:MAG: ribokinase [Alphaproteobacteria bacterium]|nr:ribokinase [Alphaproteobacteria bacterium]